MAKAFRVSVATKVPAGSYTALIVKGGFTEETELVFTDETSGWEIDRDLSEMYGQPTLCYRLVPVAVAEPAKSDTVTISREDYRFLKMLAAKWLEGESSYGPAQEQFIQIINKES